MNYWLLVGYIGLGFLTVFRVILGIFSYKIAKQYNRYIIFWVTLVVCFGILGFLIFYLFLGFSPSLKVQNSNKKEEIRKKNESRKKR